MSRSNRKRAKRKQANALQFSAAARASQARAVASNAALWSDLLPELAGATVRVRRGLPFEGREGWIKDVARAADGTVTLRITLRNATRSVIREHLANVKFTGALAETKARLVHDYDRAVHLNLSHDGDRLQPAEI